MYNLLTCSRANADYPTKKIFTINFDTLSNVDYKVDIESSLVNDVLYAILISACSCVALSVLGLTLLLQSLL